MAGNWVLLSDDPYAGKRVWELELDENQSILRTEYYGANAFMEANAAEYRESAHERWGDGKRVASIPMHIWAREVVPRQQAGDDKGLAKWLNDPDNRAFRTFKGKV